MEIPDEEEVKEKRKFRGLIRPITSADIIKIRTILKDRVINPITRDILPELEIYIEDMEKSLSDGNGSFFMVAEEDGEIVGVMGVQKVSERMKEFISSSDPIELVHAYVKRGEEGRGIGSALLATIETKAKKEGYTEILLNSGAIYRHSWKFYDKKGFERVGLISGLYGRGKIGDAQVWRKTL